jgi:mono/diheme cytochrome c family protein
MNARISFVISVLAAAASGCFQELDPGVAGDPGANNLTFVADGGDLAEAAPIPILPAPFTGGDVDAALNQQCAYGSALCYQICGSPSCANQDNTIPAEVTTIPSVLPNGGTTADPCDVVRAQSLRIRQQSCSQCHGPPPAPGFSSFNFVLDDQALVTTIPNTVMVPLVIPGNPSMSYLLQRVALGLSGGQTGMPPPASLASNLVPASIAKTVVSPTPEDLSILYAWILNCVPGADGGAYSSSYYGGNYAPDASIVSASGQTGSAGSDAGGGG